MADNFVAVGTGPNGTTFYVDIEDFATSTIVTPPGPDSSTTEAYGRERMQIAGRVRAAIADVLAARFGASAYGLGVRIVPSGTYAVIGAGVNSGSAGVTLTAPAGIAIVSISATSAAGGATIAIAGGPPITLPQYGSLQENPPDGTLVGASVVFTNCDSYYMAGVG